MLTTKPVLFFRLNNLTLISISLILIIFKINLNAQWVNNPSENTIIVKGVNNPVNISTADDYKGGAFIFWEDKLNKKNNEIFFMHTNGNGEVSFSNEGKKVSQLTGNQVKPVCTNNLPNSSVVLWKDFTSNANGDLFAQKVLSNGNLFWNKNGIKISSSEEDVCEYSLTSDETGNVYISFLEKPLGVTGNYKIRLQIISPDGKLKYKPRSLVVYDSPNKKSLTSIVTNKKGESFVFWNELINNKSSIFAEKIDTAGNCLFNNSPKKISGENSNVINYATKLLEDESIYLAYQSLDKQKEIYHQLISPSGKLLWSSNKQKVTNQKGSNTNPQILESNSSVIISWTNESGNGKNIFAQKFDLTGKSLWNENGIPVVEINGDQFGQRLTSDGKGGAIVTWIDKREKLKRANIYAQRILSNGKKSWNKNGVVIANHNNSEKSYTSVVSDLRGGAIITFKEKRNSKNVILGQKIFNTGTYISQIIGLETEVSGDSVKVSWYSANETPGTFYEIEKATQSDSTSSKWQIISTLNSDSKSNAQYYEYFDVPDKSGTYYYRVVQKDNNGNIQPSQTGKVNYFTYSNEIVVGQNIPNPFNDTTSIGFYLPSPSIINIEFFNSRVEVVRKIEKQSYPAGEHKITFYAEDLKPGIYFYRFESDNYVDVKKMVIVN